MCAYYYSHLRPFCVDCNGNEGDLLERLVAGGIIRCQLQVANGRDSPDGQDAVEMAWQAHFIVSGLTCEPDRGPNLDFVVECERMQNYQYELGQLELLR